MAKSGRPGDTFARPAAESLVPGFDYRKLPPLKPGSTLADLKQQTGIPFLKGFTTNHELQLFTGRYCQNPKDPDTRDVLLHYLGPHYETVIGYEGQEFLASSHWGHYLACYGPITHAALKVEDVEMILLVTKIWRRLLASAHLLSYYNRKLGEWRIVAPCTRVHLAPKESADQRVEMVLTFEWLATGRLPRQTPDWARRSLSLSPADSLKVPPSILGLYALIQVQQALEQDLPWARRWASMQSEIRGAKYPEDLPPLAYQLEVFRSPRESPIPFHFGRILDHEFRPGQHAARWAYADHITGVEIYDWPPGVNPEPPEYVYQTTTDRFVFPLARKKRQSPQ